MKKAYAICVSIHASLVTFFFAIVSLLGNKKNPLFDSNTFKLVRKPSLVSSLGLLILFISFSFTSGVYAQRVSDGLIVNMKVAKVVDPL